MTAHTSTPECQAFEALLGEYLEGGLDEGRRASMDAHRASCRACATLVSELDAIVMDASALPPLTPPRDLWPGIEARINTPVVSLGARSANTRLERSVSMRAFAAAALLLVTVSSGVTWMVMRTREDAASRGTSPAVANGAQSPASQPAAPAPTVAVTPGASPSTSSPAVASPSTSQNNAPSVVANGSQREIMPGGEVTRPESRARLASRGNDDVGLIYEREISAMRRIVDERLGDLDSATVAAVERNLAIIDRAIEDSRRALARDPRSRVLSTQLDRALENKLAIMRRVALL